MVPRFYTFEGLGQNTHDRFKHLPAYLSDTIKHNLNSDHDNHLNPEGVLNLCLGTAISYGLITSKLDEFVQRYPKIKLNVKFSTNIVQWPADDVNIVLAAAYIKGKNLENRFIRTEYYRLFCSSNYAVKYGIPLKVGDLNNHRILGVLDMEGQPMDYVKIHNIKTKEIYVLDIKSSSIKTNNLLHMRQIGLNSDYIFSCIDALCAKDLENGSVIPILPEWVAFKIDFYLVSHKQVTEIEQLFIDFIYHCMGKTFHS